MAIIRGLTYARKLLVKSNNQGERGKDGKERIDR
jgi:hypothetical protein